MNPNSAVGDKLVQGRGTAKLCGCISAYNKTRYIQSRPRTTTGLVQDIDCSSELSPTAQTPHVNLQFAEMS